MGELCEGRSSDCEVELDVPEACVEGGRSDCPIVFFLHGSGGTNDWFRKTSGVHEAQMIGVYPNGDCRGWNTGPKDCNLCEWDDFECTDDPNEGEFVAKTIAAVRSLGALGNVYVRGNSNGAALALRLAANAGDELPIAGIIATVTQLLASPERSGPARRAELQPAAVRRPAGLRAHYLGHRGRPHPLRGGHLRRLRRQPQFLFLVYRGEQRGMGCPQRL